MALNTGVGGFKQLFKNHNGHCDFPEPEAFVAFAFRCDLFHLLHSIFIRSMFGLFRGANMAEVEQPVPRDNRANQLKIQHTERQLNKELLANRILAE